MPAPCTQMLSYFDDLSHELIDEFIRYLKSHYDGIGFIIESVPSTIAIPASTTLATTLQHCFPMLYGMQQHRLNQHQQCINAYCRAKISSKQACQQREQVIILIEVIKLLTECKHLQHILAQKTALIRQPDATSSELLLLVKSTIQNQCQALTDTFMRCRNEVANNNKDQNIFSGLISRTRGFSSFTAKKLNRHNSSTKTV